MFAVFACVWILRVKQVDQSNYSIERSLACHNLAACVWILRVKLVDQSNYSIERSLACHNLPTFRLNAPVVIRAKVKEVWNNVAIYNTHHWRSTKVGEDCSSLPASSSQRSSNQGLPVLHLGWSALPQVSSGCAKPPSPTTPVLCHGPVRWSPPSGLGGGAPTHAPLQLTSPSSPSHRHLGVTSVSSPVSVWSPQCRLGRSCRGYDIPHWIVYREVMYHSCQHRAESPPGLKDYSDVKLPANTPDVLTHPSHIGYHHQRSLLLSLLWAA